MTQRLYITTAIDYVNSTPHIGTAYEKIGADVVARFYRQRGAQVHLQMGNDEHSTNVAKAAKAQGMEPLAYCDTMEEAFRKTWDHLGIAYDGFIRTTAKEHAASVGALFSQIFERKAPDGSPNIYKSHYKGWYCDSCEAFYTEKDLQEKKCPVHGREAKWVEEENYFFALSKYRDFLLTHIREHPEFILPAIRRNEIIKLLEGGLHDISVSREGGEWGIHLPIDPKHTVYVWFDALINYVTAAGYGSDAKRFTTWWDDATVLHIIGKDITRFHCVIWPAMLQAAGIPLPQTVFGHGFVYHRGEKMSKTLGNVVNPLELVQQYGADPLRYFLLRENSFGRDGDFTWEQFIDRYNGDLANGIGNLVSRTMGMITRYLDGTVAPSEPAEQLHTPLNTATRDLAMAMDYTKGDLNFHEGLAAIWTVITAADKFINDHEPWNLQKAGKHEAVAAVLGQVTDAIRGITVLLYPFLPDTAEKIWRQMGFAALLGPLNKQSAQEFPARTKPLTLGKSETLFPRIEAKDKPMETTAAAPAPAVPEGVQLITIGDFAKVDLRVATITAAEPVEGADRLLKIQVEVGEEKRQIVAGIAQHYTPDELVGKQVCVVFNLKPAKLRGVESQGMLLAASGNDTVSILTPLRPVPAGSRVK